MDNKKGCGATGRKERGAEIVARPSTKLDDRKYKNRSENRSIASPEASGRGQDGDIDNAGSGE